MSFELDHSFILIQWFIIDSSILNKIRVNILSTNAMQRSCSSIAGGGGWLRWSESRSVKEVAGVKKIGNGGDEVLGGKSGCGCNENGRKLGHPLKTKIPHLTFIDRSGSLGGF